VLYEIAHRLVNTLVELEKRAAAIAGSGGPRK